MNTVDIIIRILQSYLRKFADIHKYILKNDFQSCHCTLKELLILLFDLSDILEQNIRNI